MNPQRFSQLSQRGVKLFLLVSVTLAVCAAGLWWLRVRKARHLASLRFDEEPALTLISL